MLQCLISEDDEGEVLEWWGRLASADQLDLLAACDARWETCFFGPPQDAHPPPEVMGGRFLAHDDAWRSGDWETDWREYMVEHPEAANLSMQDRNSSWLTIEGHIIIRVEWART